MPASSKRLGPISRGSTAYPRKRAVTACQVCRARRTKCDQKKPACSFCVRAGVECVQEPSDQSTFDPASLAIIERLERLEQKMDASMSQNPIGLAPTSAVPAPDKDQSRRENLASILPGNLDTVLSWAVLQNSAALTSTSSHSPSISQPPLLVDELDPTLCTRWLDSFFSQVHVKNPILDEERTRLLVRKMCLDGAGWDSASCLALLVCANGALTHALGNQSLSKRELYESTSMALFGAAQKRLGPVIVSSGILQAQCVFLTGVFLMSIMKPVDAWRMFLQGITMCQGFNSINNGTVKSIDAEAEERIYWSCWKSELELRRELGISTLPQLTPDPPQLFPTIPQGCEGDCLRAWYFYLSEISLWRLETEVRRELVNLIEENYGNMLLTRLAEIGDNTLQQFATWKESLAPPVSLEEHVSPETDTDIIRFVLRGRATYLHELLSWPFIHAMINAGDSSHRVCQWASKGLAFHLERLLINRPGFYYRHHGTWLMLRSSARSAFILISFALTPSASYLLPVGWREAVQDTLSMLHHWSDEVEDFRSVADLMQHHLTMI